MIRSIFVSLFMFLALLFAGNASAQTLLVDTGAPVPPAVTSLDAAGKQNCSPQPQCGQNFQFWAGQFTLAHAASISSAQVWIGPIFFGGGMTVKIYADGGTIPGTAIYSQTYNIASSFTAGWVPFPFSSPIPVLTAGVYWLAVEPVTFTGTTGSGFSSNMDGHAPQPLAHYAVWNGSFGYRAFPVQIGLGMRILGTTFPDQADGTVGLSTAQGASFGFGFNKSTLTGDFGETTQFQGAGEIPAAWSIVRANLPSNSLGVGVWGSTSGPCSPADDACTAGSSTGRAIAFRTWLNNSNTSITFNTNAVLDGSFASFGGNAASAVASLYLLDPTMFANTINTSGVGVAQFLTGSQSIGSRFPPAAILSQSTNTFNGPTGSVFAPISAPSYTLGPNAAVTILFDLNVNIPVGNQAAFISTFKPAPVFFTDLNNNPVTQLLAVGPASAPVATPTAIALAPASSTSQAGTSHTVTATVTDSTNAPVPNTVIFFNVSGGPNTITEALSTDANGQASFTYNDAGGPGTDSIQAHIGSVLSNIVTKTWTSPGALNRIVISPKNSTIAPGGSQAYTAEAFDAFNTSLGNVTASTTFSISPDGSCNIATCTANTNGTHTVTGNDGGKTSDATLLVGAGKIDTTTTVTSNHNPSIVGQNVTFTATVSPAFGSGVPSGTVDFLDGSTSLASGVTAAGGTATFSTSALSIGAHSITAIYHGDAAFNATGTGSSTATALVQQVQYGVCTVYDPTRAVKSGATFPLKMYLCDASNNDVSSSGTVVQAKSIFMTSGYTGTPENAGNSNPDSNFRYDATMGASGGYIFNLSTKGLASGTYGLTFTVNNDPTTHTLSPAFGVK